MDLVTVSFDERGLELLVRDVKQIFGDACVRAVDMGVHEAAEDARAHHKFRNRTGALEESIIGRVLLRAHGGALGEVAATSDHASFVEEGTPAHEIRPKEGFGFTGPLQKGQSRRKQDDIGTHRVALRWFDDPVGRTGVHFARVVHHPGSKPYPFMGPAFLKCEAVMLREIQRAPSLAQRLIDAQ